MSQGTITVPSASGPVEVGIPDPTAGAPGAVTAKLWSRAVAADYVQRKNAEGQASYDQQVKAYNSMMASGSYPIVLHPPAAPASYLYVPDDPNDPASQATWNQDGPPFASTIPLATINNGLIPQPDKTPGQTHVGNVVPYSNGMVFSAPGDTNVEGTETTIVIAGMTIKLRKHNVPFGGYWEVVK